MPNQPAPATVNGPIQAVPCAHCGAKNDYRILESQSLLDTGHEVSCDKCGFLSEIVGIQPVTVVVVRKSMNQARNPAHARAAQVHAQRAQLAQANKPQGFFSKLLGTGKR